MGSGSSKPRRRLRKQQSRPQLNETSSNLGGAIAVAEASQPEVKTELQEHNERYRDQHATTSTQTGERHDFTSVWHSLAHRYSEESLEEIVEEVQEEDTRERGERILKKLSPELWRDIVAELSPLEAANLAVSSKTMLWLLGYEPWDVLNLPENNLDKIEFLTPMDIYLPNHLFCFACARYHLRNQKGRERLQPADVLNPVFKCPNATDNVNPPPRARITPMHNLPFTFAQLAMRANRFSPSHGISPESLGKRWKDEDSGWSHTSAFHIHKGHLLMRVVSSCFAQGGLPPAAMRHLLYYKGDFSPYFSVCTHWRDGELMNFCKCALGHIPAKSEGFVGRMTQDFMGEMQQGVVGSRKQVRETPNTVVSQCALCRPMRRCIDCPTEYLIELKLVEDRAETNPRARFRQAISVTRWSDLGDGRSPLGKEWAAVTTERGTGYASFEEIGKRTVSGTFESRFGDSQGSQRVLSLNPKKQRKGEAGHNWY